MTKILVIATYPIKNGQHGGQRRVSAIVESYKNVFRKVKFVSVFPPDYYQHYTLGDIAVKGNTRRQTTDSPYTGDITCGKAIYEDPYVKKRFKKMLLSFQPDIIQIEQVFPYLGLKPLLEELGMQPKIILSSHNIEYTHKLHILNNAGYAKEAVEASEIIRECESELATKASLTVAVSQDDAVVLKELGAKNIVLATNGINSNKVTSEATKHWQDFKTENEIAKIATFIGSAHPPNWFGFEAMIGSRMGFLPRDKKLILAGSISDYFKDNFTGLKPEYVTFWRRVFAAGRISDDLLAGLIDSSEIILLPITEGGGSNLKTAEAILSGKKVVATSYAFRSFEEYLKLPNIFIADSPKEFRSTILKAFDSPYLDRNHDEIKLAEKVQWKYCLKPMVEGAAKL